jgi:hypothetical protein
MTIPTIISVHLSALMRFECQLHEVHKKTHNGEVTFVLTALHLSDTTEKPWIKLGTV